MTPTADSITDEQIRTLWESTVALKVMSLRDHKIAKACRAALGISRGGATAMRNARRFLAEILSEHGVT